MKIAFTVGVYQARRPTDEQWVALVPSMYAATITGQGEVRLRERMIERLRDVLRRAAPADQDLFQLSLGTELMRVPIDAKLDTTRAHGTIPLIVEPRWIDEDHQRLFVYHPLRRDHWFIATDHTEIPDLANIFVRHYWAELDDDDIAPLLTTGKDALTRVAFSTEPRSLLDQLPSRKKDGRNLAVGGSYDRVLSDLGVDETQRSSASTTRHGVPRQPYRDRLGYLLGGARPRSVAVVGPPGAGKSTLIEQWIADRLVEDGYPIHRNLDRVHHVWRVAGKRLIAGMQYLGQWEERCLAVLDECRRHRGILWIEDLHLFGRLGQSRQSERSFADFFRGSVRRGDVAIVGELTAEQHARLERDAPGLAEALAVVAVPAASPGETALLLLHEVRTLELTSKALHPFVPRTALELGAALFPWRARPGVAIEIVRRVAADAQLAAKDDDDADKTIGPRDVLDYLARTTGLSSKLIALDEPLDPDEVEAAFAARVIGQATATRAAADVIVRFRAGLADPSRPVSVMLFTGPTGTGKTELATAIAEYLYGDQSRLVRIDMGELSGPDAVSRLIGDRWNPEGLLTARVRTQPFCVVLLDEIEKAHTQALHLLLQLFDEGRLTDAAGDVTSFASSVVIMTSNLGSRSAQPIGFGETRDRILADVAKAVREFFPIELFNRIDQVVPFAPLTHEVAAKVVDKELGKLLGRRGLRERNTFVYAGNAVRRRAVADAFDPRYGARTVKRWLEDKIGGALTDVLASAPPARLRIIRLAEDAGEIAATLEPMPERTPVPGIYVLEGALDLATAALEPSVATGAAAIRRVRASAALAEAKGRARGEISFYVDELGQRLVALGELLGVPPDDDDGDGDGDDDDHEDRYEQRRFTSGDRSYARRVQTRGPAGATPMARAPSRDALVAAIAEALLIERAMPELLDPEAHTATAVLSRIGDTAEASGLWIAARALGASPWFDDGACHGPNGIVPMTPAWFDRTKPDGAGHLNRTTRDIVIGLRGLFVRAALDAEAGTWMIRAAASEPDVVRVEMRGGVRPALDVIRAHVAARVELERVLEHGGKLPPNPDALLPVTRTLTYRPPLRSGESFAVELEDFATGWVDRGNVRDLELAFSRARHLAWSRT